MFLDLVRKYQQQYAIKVFAYVLMPDHVHLLVEMEKPAEGAPGQQKSQAQELSDFMRDLNNNYTKYFNGRYLRKGHLFRERFKAAIIEKEPYLLKMTAYIHLNPQRLNLVKDARDYPHSSYQSYLYNEQVKDKDIIQFKQAISEIVSLLDNKDYSEYVNGLTQEDGDLIHKKLQRGGILGSEDFVKQVKEEVQSYMAQGEAQALEIKGKQSYKMFITVGSFLFIIIAASAGVYFLSIDTNKGGPVSAPKPVNLVTQGIQGIEDLKLTEWDVKVGPLHGEGDSSVDRITFLDGQFFSAKTNALGFASSHYSISVDAGGKIIWETMQSSSHGTATWRGEVEEGKMTGVFSLKQAGKEPEDFSFMSLNYRRKK